jgi:hypothetical protein
MAKLVQLSDLVQQLKKPQTIVAPTAAKATPALGLLLDSPTRLKEQLERNLPGMEISIARVHERLQITSADKQIEVTKGQRLTSKKPKGWGRRV